MHLQAVVTAVKNESDRRGAGSREETLSSEGAHSRQRAWEGRCGHRRARRAHT